jgi:hypothetical protein
MIDIRHYEQSEARRLALRDIAAQEEEKINGPAY